MGPVDSLGNTGLSVRSKVVRLSNGRICGRKHQVIQQNALVILLHGELYLSAKVAATSCGRQHTVRMAAHTLTTIMAKLLFLNAAQLIASVQLLDL